MTFDFRLSTLFCEINSEGSTAIASMSGGVLERFLQVWCGSAVVKVYRLAMQLDGALQFFGSCRVVTLEIGERGQIRPHLPRILVYLLGLEQIPMSRLII